VGAAGLFTGLMQSLFYQLVKIITGWYMMRLHDPLDGLLFNRTSTRVLRALCTHPTRQLTSSEVAQAAGAPTHRVLEALRAFQLEGIVSSRVVGPAYWWSVRERHPLVKAAARFFQSERRASEQLTETIRSLLVPPAGVDRLVIFGSAARREQEAGSDLDLLVVVAAGRQREGVEGRLEELRTHLSEKYGTRLRPLLYTRSEYRRKRETPLVRNIERDGIALHAGEG